MSYDLARSVWRPCPTARYERNRGRTAVGAASARGSRQLADGSATGTAEPGPVGWMPPVQPRPAGYPGDADNPAFRPISSFPPRPSLIVVAAGPHVRPTSPAIGLGFTPPALTATANLSGWQHRVLRSAQRACLPCGLGFSRRAAGDELGRGRSGIRASLALGCRINETSVFCARRPS